MRLKPDPLLIEIGRACAKYRREVLDVPQRFVAVDVGCSIPNVSQFEHGTNDSAKLLLWYITQGADLGGVNYYERV